MLKLRCQVKAGQRDVQWLTNQKEKPERVHPRLFSDPSGLHQSDLRIRVFCLFPYMLTKYHRPVCYRTGLDLLSSITPGGVEVSEFPYTFLCRFGDMSQM